VRVQDGPLQSVKEHIVLVTDVVDNPLSSTVVRHAASEVWLVLRHLAAALRTATRIYAHMLYIVIYDKCVVFLYKLAPLHRLLVHVAYNVREMCSAA
jgi:hypothetical protein